MTLDTKLTPDGNQILVNDTRYQMEATFTGTGKMNVVARDPWNGDLDGFGGLGFQVISGQVKSLTIAITFDHAISPRDVGTNITTAGDPEFGPFASITGYLLGDGTPQSGDFNMRYELFDTNLQPLNGSIPTPTFIDNRNEFPFETLSPADSQLKWTDMNNDGSVPMPYGSSFGIHDFKDGNTIDDHVRRIVLTVTPTGPLTEFAEGSQFNYSVDGTTAVPEPSSLMFLLSVVTGLLGYRRRS